MITETQYATIIWAAILGGAAIGFFELIVMAYKHTKKCQKN